jgi:hypothetical protein
MPGGDLFRDDMYLARVPRRYESPLKLMNLEPLRLKSGRRHERIPDVKL